jgi:hypothetical protein
MLVEPWPQYDYGMLKLEVLTDYKIDYSAFSRGVETACILLI